MLVIQYLINVVVMVIVLKISVNAMPDGITIQIVVPKIGILCWLSKPNLVKVNLLKNASIPVHREVGRGPPYFWIILPPF